MALRIEFDPVTRSGDLALTAETASLVRFADDGGLETAVLLSLFTDRRANPDDETPASRALGPRALRDDLRGYWGDEFSEVEGDRLGSRLWLLKRAKMTPRTVELARIYAREALQWLVEDGVADELQIDAELGDADSGQLKLGIRIVKGKRVAHRFDYAWSLLDAA